MNYNRKIDTLIDGLTLDYLPRWFIVFIMITAPSMILITTFNLDRNILFTVIWITMCVRATYEGYQNAQKNKLNGNSRGLPKQSQ